MLTFVIVLSSIVQLAVSFFIFKKGRKNLSYLLFFYLSLITWAWALLNYISVVGGNAGYLTLVVRLIMVLAVIQIGLFYMFSHAFPQALTKNYLAETKLFIVVTLAVAAVALSPLLFRSVALNNGVIESQTGPGIVVFILYALFCIVNAFRILIYKLKRSVGLKRLQLLLIVAVAILNWVVVPLTNFALTLLLKSLLFVKIAPLYSLVFAVVIAYALGRRRMFDDKTVLRDTTIYIDQYLRNERDRAHDYYLLQTHVYEAQSAHVALDFSGVKRLDPESVRLLKTLRTYMKEKGKIIYFTGYSQPIFNQLRPNDE